MHFSPKKVDDLRTQAANAANCFTVKIRQIKRSDMATFLFSVHTLKQSITQGGARAADLPAQSYFDLARPGVAPPLPNCSSSRKFYSV